MKSLKRFSLFKLGSHRLSACIMTEETDNISTTYTEY